MKGIWAFMALHGYIVATVVLFLLLVLIVRRRLLVYLFLDKFYLTNVPAKKRMRGLEEIRKDSRFSPKDRYKAGQLLEKYERRFKSGKCGE